VALCDKVYVYNFANFELLDTIVTGGEGNGAGLLCISTDAGDGMVTTATTSSFSSARGEEGGMVLACPSVKRGQARVELYGHRKTVLIDAHAGALAAMVLTVDGLFLATASERGTIIRLFDTGKQRASDGGGGGGEMASSKPVMGTPLREFRRGVEQAKIGCLCFSLDKAWLGCTSDRGTVHVFRVTKEGERNADDDKAASSTRGNNAKTTKKSSSASSTASKLARSFLPSVLTKLPKAYLLEGENSYAQVRGISKPLACAFDPHQQNTIAVAGMDEYGNGCLLLAKFGPQDSNDTEGQDNHLQYNTRDSQHGRTNTPEACKTTKGEVRRLAYHRFFKRGMTKLPKNDRRSTKGGLGRLSLGDNKYNGVDLLDDTTDKIVFGDDDDNDDDDDDDDDDDGFVSVKSDRQLTSSGTAEGKKIEIENPHHLSPCIDNTDSVVQDKKEVEGELGGSSSEDKAEIADCKASQ